MSEHTIGCHTEKYAQQITVQIKKLFYGIDSLISFENTNSWKVVFKTLSIKQQVMLGVFARGALNFG